MTIDQWFFVAVLVVLAAGQVFVLWRYPDFRKAVWRYLSTAEIARRMNEWAARNQRR